MKLAGGVVILVTCSSLGKKVEDRVLTLYKFFQY